MSRGKVYGRAYRISAADAAAYRRTDRPRDMKANPIGVTSMASVNGRGAYARSARQVAAGKTKSQRLARARKVIKNGDTMAGFLKNRSTKSAGAAKKRPAAKRSSKRKVPGTNYFKTAGGRYQTAGGKFVSEAKVKASRPKRKTTAKAKPKRRVTRTATKRPVRKTAAKRRPAVRKSAAKKRTTRKVRRNASVGYSPSYSKGYDRVKRSEAAKKAAATRKRRQAAAARSAGSKTRVGKYSRVRATDPRTGKQRLSYMYETAGGKRRKIPAKVLIKSGHLSAADIKRGRAKAAARVKKEGTAFVANKKKSTARQKRAGRRLAAYMAARREGKKVGPAKASALRKVPLATGDSFKGSTKTGPMKKGSSRKVRIPQKGKRKLVANSRRRKTTLKRRAKAASPMKRNRRRVSKRRSTAKRTYKANPRRTMAKRRSTAKRTYKANRRRRTMSKRRTYKANRRRSSNPSRLTFRKNAFMANLKNAFKTGLVVGAGFLTHRVVTNLVADKLLAETFAGNQHLNTWRKPIIGLGVMAVGIPLAGMVAKKRAIEIGAGMVASWLQSSIVAAFAMAEQPEAVNALSDYSNSRVYQLRGNSRRRFRRNHGHQTSIMPRYQPVSGYQQAAAGYQQAAAGYQQAAAGMGEYFAAATGEYFAPPSLQGVGAYEAAGTLAMQATAGTRQHIDDGIRPDSDLDHQMDMMEASAGLRGLGEFYEANRNNVEQRVGQQSQWVPNGAIWAGESRIDASQMTSELSAGILMRQGGNGVLSAG